MEDGSSHDGVLGDVLILTETDWREGQVAGPGDGGRIMQAEVLIVRPQDACGHVTRRGENSGTPERNFTTEEGLECFLEQVCAQAWDYVSSDVVGRVRGWITETKGLSKTSHVDYAIKLERMLDWERVRHPVDLLRTIVPQQHLEDILLLDRREYGREWRIPMSKSTAVFSHHRVGDNTVVMVVFEHFEERVILPLRGYNSGTKYIVPTVEIAWHAIWCCMQHGKTSVKRIQESLQPRLYHMHRSVIYGFKLCIQDIGNIAIPRSLPVQHRERVSKASIPGDLLLEAIAKGGSDTDGTFNAVCEVLRSRGVDVDLGLGRRTNSAANRVLGTSVQLVQYCGASEKDAFDELLDMVGLDEEGTDRTEPPEATGTAGDLMTRVLRSLSGRGQGSIETVQTFVDVVLGTRGVNWMLHTVEEAGEVEPVLLSILEGLQVVEGGRNERQGLRLVSGFTRILHSCGSQIHERVGGCRLFFKAILEEGESLGMLSSRIRYVLSSHWLRENDRVWFTSDWDSSPYTNQREVEFILAQCNLELVSVKQRGDEKLGNALALLLLEHGRYAPPTAWQIYAAICLVSLVIRCNGAGGCSHKDHGTFNGSLVESVGWTGFDEKLGTEEELDRVLRELRMHLYEGRGEEGGELGRRLGQASCEFATRFLMDVVEEPPIGRPLELPSGFPYACLHVIPFLVGTSLIVVRIIRRKVACGSNGETSTKSTSRSVCGRSLAVWDVFGAAQGEVITGTFGTYDAARERTGESMPFILLCEGGQGQWRYYPVFRKSQLKPYKDAIGRGNEVVSGRGSFRTFS